MREEESLRPFNDLLGALSEEDVREIKFEERSRLIESWRVRLLRPGVSGARTVNAVLPHFEEWMARGWGGLNFHLTQLLTGHGCFGAYLHRIGKQPADESCAHCGDACDSAEHTLSWCPSWMFERLDLKRSLGLEDMVELPLSRVVEEALKSRDAWSALSRFASIVMRRKENAERAREREAAGVFEPP